MGALGEAASIRKWWVAESCKLQSNLLKRRDVSPTTCASFSKTSFGRFTKYEAENTEGFILQGEGASIANNTVIQIQNLDNGLELSMSMVILMIGQWNLVGQCYNLVLQPYMNISEHLDSNVRGKV